MQDYDKTEQPFLGCPLLEKTAQNLQDNCQQVDNQNWRKLTGRVVGWDLYNGENYIPDMHLIDLPKILQPFKNIPFISDILKALTLLFSADTKVCILINGGTRFGILSCVLNSFLSIKKRRIALFEVYIPDNKSLVVRYGKLASQIRKYVARRMILGTSVSVVYSRSQIDVQAKFLNVPKSKFFCLPYKSLQSIKPPINLPIGGYVFSGGNSRRDYHTLFEAVRGLGIPVIVSATDPKAYAHLDLPENVIRIAAPEPAFGRLMAGSCFVVLPMLPQLIRGGGETTVCDAMWQGRPVICADDISAFEYIEEGVTGYVTPPGDVRRLRERIIELWNQPDKVAQMGRAAHQNVAAGKTSEHYSQRLRALGAIVASAKL